jgi:hypothetical protein
MSDGAAGGDPKQGFLRPKTHFKLYKSLSYKVAAAQHKVR